MKELTKAQREFLLRVANKQSDLNQDEMDHIIKLFTENPSAFAKFLSDKEDVIDNFANILDSPPMIERAHELKRAGRIQQGLDAAVNLFNDSYNLYLSSEQQRVGEEELRSIEEVRLPKHVQPIPELESAIRQARMLGDPGSAISMYKQAAERSQLGALRAAQLGSRGQAGSLGAQAQAIHQQKLSSDARLPLMARDIQLQGLQAQAPFIQQKQNIDLYNRRGDIEAFPSLLRRQIMQEQFAGLTSQLGRQGQAQAYSNIANRIPKLVGNLYSQQYSTLPPEVAQYLSGLTYGV